MTDQNAYVKMLNTVVPDLKPWLEERIARGQSAYQTLTEFRALLAGDPGIGPAGTGLAVRREEGTERARAILVMTERARATLADYPYTALLDELHARLMRHATPHDSTFDLADKAP